MIRNVTAYLDHCRCGSVIVWPQLRQYGVQPLQKRKQSQCYIPTDSAAVGVIRRGQLQHSVLLLVQQMYCNTCLDFLPVLEVDPGGHITNELNKTLLPRCDVELHVEHPQVSRQHSGDAQVQTNPLGKAMQALEFRKWQSSLTSVEIFFLLPS